MWQLVKIFFLLSIKTPKCQPESLSVTFFFQSLNYETNISSSTEGIFLYLFSNTIFTLSKLESFLSITWLIFVAILFLLTFASDKFRKDIKINRYIKFEIVT